jgi:hypothetical protein
MTDQQLILQVENLISKNIAISYNANCPKISDIIFENQQLQNIVLNCNNCRIDIHKNNLQIFSTRWRIPLTRIYFSKFSAGDFEFFEVCFNKISVFIFKNFSQEDFELEIKIPDKNLIFVPLDKSNKIIEGKIIVSKSTQAAYIINPDKNISHKGVYSFLEETLLEEKKNNPAFIIETTDVLFLQQIDKYWSEIPIYHIDKKNIATIENATQYILSNELKQFINYDSIISDNYKGHPSSYFFKTVISEEKKDSAPTLKYLQNFWNTISLPAKKQILLNLLLQNSEEIISFLLLAYHYNFWWADVAEKYFQNLLDQIKPDYLPLFKLVFRLKKQFNISKQKSSIRVNFNPSDDNHTYTLPAGRIFVKQVSLKHRKSNSLIINDLKIKINKDADVVFQNKDNSVFIKPHSYQYDEKIDTLLIKINEYYCQIPLCWRSFTLSFQNVRFKFLFKKNRYQISVKSVKWIKKLNVGPDEIEFKESIYQKVHLKKLRQKPVLNVYFYDKKGRSLVPDELPYNNEVVMQVMASDYNGFLADRIQMKKLGKKVWVLNAFSNKQERLKIDEPFSLWIPKCPIVEINPCFSKSLVHDIKNTEAELLPILTGIFVEDIATSNEILDLLKNTFAMNFRSFSTKDIYKSNFRFNIMIIHKQLIEYSQIHSYTYHKELTIKAAGNIKVIQIDYLHFKNWLEYNFN